MGSVAMGTGGSWIFEGYRITETAYCLYCDRCGSFKIMCWIPIQKWMGLIVSLVVLVIGMKYIQDVITTLCIAFFLLVMITSDTVRHLAHFCMKCGNMHITKDNVLNYLDYDKQVLDTPYEKTIRYYRED